MTASARAAAGATSAPRTASTNSCFCTNPVERPLALSDLTRGDRGREQRVREPKAVAVELEHACPKRVVEAGGSSVDGELDQPKRRLRRRRNDATDLVRLRRQSREPLDDQTLERLGHRKLRAVIDPAAAPLERAGQLQREGR